MTVVSCAAEKLPEDAGAIDLKLAELRAAVDQFEGLALGFRQAEDGARRCPAISLGGQTVAGQAHAASSIELPARGFSRRFARLLTDDACWAL